MGLFEARGFLDIFFEKLNPGKERTSACLGLEVRKHGSTAEQHMPGTSPFCPRAPTAAHRPHTAQTVLVSGQHTTAQQQDFSLHSAGKPEAEEEEGAFPWRQSHCAYTDANMSWETSTHSPSQLCFPVTCTQYMGKGFAALLNLKTIWRVYLLVF